MSETMEVHGEVRVDPYHWLRRRDDPTVIAYLQRENRYTDEQMKHTKGLQQKLFNEMTGRIQETDRTVEVKHGDYFYYSRTVKGLQYPIHCRKRGHLEADEQILLDENALAEGHDFFHLGGYDPSPNHRYLAYAADTVGSEEYELFIKDLHTGQPLSDKLERVAADFEWANDNRTLFYVRMDETHRPCELWRHQLGQDPAEDVLLYSEPDAAFHLEIGKTRSNAFVLLHLGSINSDEWHVLTADRPAETFRLIQPRAKGLEYSVDHHGQHFYIVTNHEAKNFRLVRALLDEPGLESWEEVIPHRSDAYLEDVEMFRTYMAIHLREGGMTTLHIRDMASGQSHRVDFPEPLYTVWSGENPEFDSGILRLVYCSLVTPQTVYDYHVDQRRLALRKRQPVLGGYDPTAYETRRIAATASDGTAVPISLVHRKGLARDGNNPTYLLGYGAYGFSYDPVFSSNRLSLLDRGFVLAIAHVRGGGEMGRSWYESGKLLAKRNTFSDFIACAEHLIARRYTSPERLVISGGSAGGLLIGVALNMRPDLFRAAVANVPFVDVINTMLDRTIPLTVIEYEEWGDPHEKKTYDYLKSYSPYDNVSAQDYPHLLVNAGLNDPRVQYWEPTKWVAKLRSIKTDDNLLLLRTNMDAGHSGASGRYDHLRELAFDYAFILDRLGLEE